MRQFVRINPAVAALLNDREDADDMVNSVLLAYLSGDFFRRADIAGTVVVDGYYERYDLGVVEFDTITAEFSGIRIDGEVESNALFIANQKLQNLLLEHQVVLVLKSPRTEGIRSKKVNKLVTAPPKRELS